VLAALVFLGAGASVVSCSSHRAQDPGGAQPGPPPPLPSQPPPSVIYPAAPGSFVDLVKTASPAVVYISTTQLVPGQVVWTPWGPEREAEEENALGTGFIIEDDGYILTNNHVVAHASDVEVQLDDGRTFKARIIGTDPLTDLGLLKIDASDKLPTLSLGDSDALQVGEWVVAIGNPLGLQKTVTAGIVSAKGRANQDISGGGPAYQDFIQTDAAINPGNSGGPLINMTGQVVGVNSAVDQGAQGIGFAIPINMARQVVPLLKRDGHVTRAALGVGIAPVTPAVEKQFGLDTLAGALVANVLTGGPADQAGIRSGDVITSVDGKDVDSTSLPLLVSLAGVGHVAQVTVNRAGKVQTVAVTLGQLQVTQR
jgi:serine protease Do